MQQNYIDMHTHTIYSDGELSPNNLIKEAYDSGIRAMAITDHDTILGLKNINYNNVPKDMKIINGIELTAKVSRGRMHILGYDFDINNKELNDKMAGLKNNSYYSIIALLNQIKIDYGITFDSNDIKDIFNSLGNIGRPHLARLMVKYGYVKHPQEAFDKYLIDANKKIGKQKKGIEYEECIKLIKDANGLCVLAHPNQLKMDDKKLEETIKNMILLGLDGIEVYHSCHTKQEQEKYYSLAKKYNLLISGGSDYHGINTKPDVKLGVTTSGKIKHLTLLDKIKER
ncbi:MAG: PHP domain-containing protein [Bacilli bacterium]|nr:PHP domain-containing protein [Bacilli bacterium]